MSAMRTLASTLWDGVRTLFLPQIQVRPMRSLYEGDPEQARKERPFLASSQTRWFQSDLEAAIRLADTGDLSMAARIARSMRRDATYAGVLSTRAGGLTRLPKIFRGTPDVLAELDCPDRVGLFDRIHPAKELELLDADGICLGVGVGEYLPFPNRPEPIFVRLDPEFLRYRWSEDRWYYVTTGGHVPITPGDGRWVLHTPGGYQAPWTNGLWPSLGRAFIAKEHAYLYRENYSGKLANPARVAYSPAGAAESQRQSFFQRVMAWGLNTVFGLPPGWDVKLLESNGRGYEVFTDTIASSDREFMIGVAGQIVTVDGGAGFANADIHATIRSDLIQGDGDGLAQTLNAYGMRPLINRLFGGGARGTVAWDTRPPGDLKAEADAIAAASDAIAKANEALAPYGMRLDAREMATRFKMPYEIVGPGLAKAPTLADPAATSTLESDLEPGDAAPASPPTDEAAAALAAKMTEHGVPRCEHGSSNRCRLCGVERVRDFVPGEDGDHAWQVAWRPILASAPARRLALVAGGAS